MPEIDIPTDQIVSCGDVSCELLVDPISRPTPDPITVTTKPKHRHIVLVDNKKPNSMAILKRAQAKLKERGIEVEDEIRVKQYANVAMSDEMLDDLARNKGLILCGVSD